MQLFFFSSPFLPCSANGPWIQIKQSDRGSRAMFLDQPAAEMLFILQHCSWGLSLPGLWEPHIQPAHRAELLRPLVSKVPQFTPHLPAHPSCVWISRKFCKSECVTGHTSSIYPRGKWEATFSNLKSNKTHNLLICLFAKKKVMH